MIELKLAIKAAICVVFIDVCAGIVSVDSEWEQPAHDVGAALDESNSEVVVGSGNLYRGEKSSEGITTEGFNRDQALLDLAQVTLP